MRIERIKLKKLNNTRDLGGMKTSDGKTIKYGKLIRSGKLSDLPIITVEALRELGITTVVDLRIQAECYDHPDTMLESSRYIWQPVVTTPIPVVTNEQTMRRTMKVESYRLKKEFENIDSYMVQTYRSILFYEEGQVGLKQFLRIVIEEDGCILWHCASGKDRAGICAMLIEGLLGVDEQTILNDYMASRRFWRRKFFFNKIGLALAPVSLRFKKILFAFMRIKREYMQAVLDEMKSRYGGITGYCKTVLGICDDDIKLLKEKYLE